MRRVFILFMIVLLPLRGWAGNLMGLQMATTGMAVQAASAMSPDCPMHAQAAAAKHDTGAAQPPAGTEACTSCDLCIPMAELAGTRLDVLSFAAHAKPLTAGVDFISASAAQALKPPIS